MTRAAAGDTATIAVRDQQNSFVIAKMREHGGGWVAACQLAALCSMLSDDRGVRRVIVDRALRRLRHRGLVESSGGGLWRAVG